MQTSQRPSSNSAKPALAKVAGPKSPVPLLGSARRPAPTATTFVKILTPALLCATLWTQVWVGMIGAVLICIATLAAVTSLAKLFGEAGKNISWASQVGFGEKIWLNRLLLPVPAGINYRLTTLYAVFCAGALIAALGGLTAQPILSASGLVVAYAAQFVWFGKLIDLYRLMKDRNPLYRFWTVEAENDNLKNKRVQRKRS